MIIALRSLLFALGMGVSTVIATPVILLIAPLPFHRRHAIAINWARFNLWWLRVSCGLRHEVEGLEHIPSRAGVVMSKHQSAWETLALGLLFRPQSWVLKRELLRIPFFGWGLAAMNPIAIDRKAGRRAVRQVLEEGTQRIADGVWVVVFPEGTRVAPGTTGRYHMGGVQLARKAERPVVPVAHNAGRYWPRHGFRKRPGTIRLVIGRPVPTAGRRPDAVLEEVKTWIETTTARLDEARGGAPAGGGNEGPAATVSTRSGGLQRERQ